MMNYLGIGESMRQETGRWQRFWFRGRWWKAVLAVVVYLGIYELAGQGVNTFFGALIEEDVFATPASVFFSIGAPLAVGSLVLIIFVATNGSARRIFGSQPVSGRWWMWFFVVLAVAPIVLRFLGIDYSVYAPGVVVTSLAVGLLIGFAEELLYRGVVVDLLRSAGHREMSVAVISSGIFALSHSLNIFSGQPAVVVVLTVAFAFGYGMVMYLVMRATGSIIWPMVIHAMDDPSTFLASGGVDESNLDMQSPFLDIAAPFNFYFFIAGVIGIVFIRGRAARRTPEVASSSRLTNERL
jgi:uncharacterized protein